jgi:hypothetical protein
MPRPRRLLRFAAIAPDGRRYVVEEVPRGRYPQVRVWDPSARRYQRHTLAVSLRDADHRPNRLAIREALRLGEELVMTKLARRTEPILTMEDVLAFATTPGTAPERSETSEQDKEWLRAVREMAAVVPLMLPLTQFTAQHLTLIALSVLLRTALGLTVDAWGRLLGAANTAIMAGDLQLARSAMHAAYTAQNGVAGKGAAEAAAVLAKSASRWPVLCAQLVRAMCNYAAEKDARFKPVGGLKFDKDFHQQLVNARKSQRIVQPAPRPSRPRYPEPTCLALTRLLCDPRYEMQALIATVSNPDAAYRVTRRLIRQENGVVQIGIDVGGAGRTAINWRPLSADASAYFLNLLATTYAEFEAQYVEGDTDYAFLSGHTWDGVRLVAHPTAELPDVDPRYRLLLSLGFERRSEQMLICCRHHLVVVDDAGRLGLDERTLGTKVAALQMLSPSQERRLGFELRFGYLADLERVYRETLQAMRKGRAAGVRGVSAPPTYPLFPEERLARGRAKPASDRTHTKRAANGTAGTPVEELKPANTRTLADWNRQLERALGVEHEEGRALRGWRRGFADVYDGWTYDAKLLDRLWDHTPPMKADGGSTRSRVYVSAANLRLLEAMAELVEYGRAEYPRTGRPRRPTPG